MPAVLKSFTIPGSLICPGQNPLEFLVKFLPLLCLIVPQLAHYLNKGRKINIINLLNFDPIIKLSNPNLNH